MHDHPHTHDHHHDHDHGHHHDHHHDHAAGGKNEEILGVLLDHWANHNEDHAKEYRTWMEKMTEAGKEEVAQAIKEAIELVDQANVHLRDARKKLAED